MSGNEKNSSRYLGDSLQLTNWILYSGAMCNTAPDLVHPKMSPTLSFSVMYQKPFIYRRNRTSYK